VADLVELCELLELERPIVLGQSFGGVVALAAASRHPELASKLVVSSSLAKLRLDRALPMFERLGGPEVRAVAERHFDELSDESAQEFLRVCLPVYNQKPMDPDVLARVRLNLDVGNHFFRNEFLEIDLLPELGAITCPTLVLAGELDPITPVADAEDIAAAIPHAELRVFDGAGHGVFRDKPDEALEVIREFVLR
jgi:proline iminopeptidase